MVLFQPFADPIEVGEQVVKVTQAEGLCMGYIGKSENKFCTLTAAECGIESHKKSRAMVATGHLYIRDTRVPGAAFLRPCLNVNTLEKGVVQRLLETQKEVGQLRDEFTLIAGQEGKNDAQIGEAKEIIRKSVAFRTP